VKLAIIRKSGLKQNFSKCNAIFDITGFIPHIDLKILFKNFEK
jgi:hypothetical protein